MKTNKFFALILGLVAMLFITSCVENDDYATPEVLVPAVDVSSLGTKTTFAAVIARYNDAVADGDQVGVFSTEFDAPLYIEGYVVSSDATGNFFEEVIIQNSTDENDANGDERRGLKIEINERDLANYYNFGRKVYVKLNGLAIGLSNGVFSIGKADGNGLDQLEPFEYKDFVIRDQEVATIIPKEVTINDFTTEDLNTFIKLNDMQINRTELDLTYAGEVSDQFDGFRTLENCETNATILIQTSTFADFKSQPVPQLRGSIEGILSRDFGDDFNVIVINSTDDVNFNNPERCDPIELDCGIAAVTGTTNLFNDDFESQTNNTLITGNGWTNFIEAGTEGWEAYTQTGTNSSLGRSARVGSFNSNDASSIAWLITPAVDLDANSGVTINFKTSNSFADGSEMELLFSTDWDGTEANIASATWGILPAAYIVQDSDFFGAWFDSENVDLSCGSGIIHIAFKYTGSGQSGFDGTYELDEISIDAQ
ncbi:DUF5689 domain-containing protein [Lacinutrix sp. Hel_I_90]|uniref:DUF5689 domain-containing protein n=1 Tax=Lacinutrix sp. Hel_I_90 TaxID=1249999 RepID=UPI0005C8A747|nr:DUF5689 domain-containing protein [Lacinutrix sp. Hel_I_90]